MIKRLLIPVLGISLLWIAGSAQDRIEVVSSVSLPDAMEGKLAHAATTPGCGDDGNITIYADEGDEDAHPELFRLSPNGNLLAHIDIQHLHGFTPDALFDFASGPNGETYLIFQNSYPWNDEDEHRVVVEGTTSPITELLRFTSTGELISRTQLQPQFEASKVAVFSGGTVLVIGRAVGQRYNRGPLVGRFLTVKGEFLREVALPPELSARYPDRRYETPILVTLAVPGTDRVWLVRTGNSPALSVITEKGDVLFTTKLKGPEGFRVINPRVAGDRLFAALFPVEQKAKRESLYAQFDSVTGNVMQVVLAPGPRGLWNAVCNSSNGMYFINTQERTLNVLAVAPPK